MCHAGTDKCRASYAAMAEAAQRPRGEIPDDPWGCVPENIQRVSEEARMRLNFEADGSPTGGRFVQWLEVAAFLALVALGIWLGYLSRHEEPFGYPIVSLRPQEGVVRQQPDPASLEPSERGATVEVRIETQGIACIGSGSRCVIFRHYQLVGHVLVTEEGNGFLLGRAWAEPGETLQDGDKVATPK